MPVKLQKNRPPARETAPPSYERWRVAQQSAADALDAEVQQWQFELGEFHKIAKRKLYEADNFTRIDLHFHRAGICELISAGEMLVVKAYELMAKGTIPEDQFDEFQKTLNREVEALMKLLHQWHGAPEDQADIPDSFKRGFQEIAEGKVVDMEKALKEAP